MAKWLLIMLVLLSSCVSSKESDKGWIGRWRIDRMEVYSANTNELIRTLVIDNLNFYRIYGNGALTLSMEKDGQIIWRLEADEDDIIKPDESSDRLELNLSKFEFIVIEWLNRYDCRMEIRNGSLVNGFNGLVDENEQLLIYVYMTEFV